MSLRRVLLMLPLAATLVAAQQAAPLTPEQMAQQGQEITSFEAAELEQKLKTNPDELEARAKLIGYYFYQWMPVGEKAAKAARRRHILWVIRNHPEWPLTTLFEAGIETRGSALADPAAFEEARKAWLGHLETRGNDARVLGNAAVFFQLTDRELAERCLMKAQKLEPHNTEWDWRLGYTYALAILGVDAVAFNGQPTSVDPVVREGPFAAKARKALESTGRPMTLAVAGNVLYRYGTMLAPTEDARIDFVEDAERLFRKAADIEPRNPTWARMLKQMEGLKEQMRSPAGPRLNGPRPNP